MITGFDIYHGDSDVVDWRTLSDLILTKDIYFAFLKASEGTRADTKFHEFRQECDKLWLISGPYHFFLPTVDIGRQISVLTSQVGELRAGDLPPSVDVEWTLIKDKMGEIKRPELWDQVAPRERIAVLKNMLEGTERAFAITPIVYTAAGFWKEYIVQPNKGEDLSFFSRYPLWLVDLKGNADIPNPWTGASLIQNHFGELAAANAPMYDKLDHDAFKGTVLQLLSMVAPGKTFASTPDAPCVSLVRDVQSILQLKGYYVGASTGSFDDATALALGSFQSASGLQPSGVLDEKTWKKLLPLGEGMFVRIRRWLRGA
jgi:GH25 family lysozyme M1 (1,4-beta-N-acetylmuramidase)